jgi:hypothetical protein
MYIISEDPPDQEFWSGVYQGRAIAVLHRGDRWHVYVDHMLQHRLAFATAAHAKTWLTKRVDEQQLRRPRRLLAA